MSTPARWRWEPAGMREPAARRVLYRGDQHLATAWQNEDGSWCWRLAGDRGWRSMAVDREAACRAARKAVRDEEPSKAPTLCDGCAKQCPEDETETCSCGLVVCGLCVEREHYLCNDDGGEAPR